MRRTLALVLMTSAILPAVLSAESPVCACAVCPERENDFVWENDKFGMRAYGPGEFHKWSGLDVFNKNTASNVCLTWCHRIDKGNFHENRGFGMDNYTMGASRGVGGVAMFADGEWKTYPDWESSRVIHAGDDYLEFELVYPAFSAAGKMTYHITLKRGERFFRNDVSFEKGLRDGFFAGPGIDLDPSRDHKGDLREEPGVVSLFEDPKGEGGTDGSTMEAVFVADPSQVTPMTDHMNCRVLAFKGRKGFTYWAGASWSLAGEITTPEAWHAEVRRYRASLRNGGAEMSQATLIAHRGESVDAPENTLPAYRTAVERGFGFECDIYLSKDKRLFTFHDGTLTRTTSGANTNRCTDVDWETTVSKLNVGGWGRWKGSRFDPTRPALLEEVLALARPGRKIYVEVKGNDPSWVPYIRETVAREPKATPETVVFITFGDKLCRALKREMPEFKAYFLLGAAKDYSADEVIDWIRKTGADGIDICYRSDRHTADFIARVHAAGYSFHVWTVDNPALARKAFAAGVDTLTTNRAKAVLDAQEDLR